MSTDRTRDDDGAAGDEGRPRGGVHAVELVDDHDADAPVPVHDRRRSRRRRVALGVAASGSLVVAVGALLVSPAGLGPAGFNLGSASPVEACGERLAASAVPEELSVDLTWRTVAYEERTDTDLTLLHTDDGELSGFCADTRTERGATNATTVWPAGPDDAPDPGGILPRGTLLDGWSALWGTAGEDVTGVDVHAEWDPDGVSRTFRDENGTGVVTEARMSDDGYWSAFFGPGDLPKDAEITLTWRLADGTTQSAPLDSAWTDAESGSTAFAEARRTACAPNWRSAERGAVGSRPALEAQRGDHGVTMVADTSSRWFTACVQEAAAPYSPLVTISGELPSGLPAADEVSALSTGAGGSGAAAAVGLAGTRVDRVEVTTADGTALDADVGDGYWLAWTPDLDDPEDEGPWAGATVTWFDADGARLGRSPLFP